MLVPVNEVVEDAATFLRHEIRQSGTRLKLALAPDLPTVRADRIQLQQVLVNLALNALQAMAGREAPVLTLRTSGDGDKVVLTVEDNGPGIAADHLPKLFESFFTTRANGMGLGLAIARSIIAQLDGTIAATNRTSGGARFTIVLPVHVSGTPDHTKV